MDIPNFDVLVWSVRLQNVLSSDTHGTKTMENGLLEATNRGKLGQNLRHSGEEGMPSQRRHDTTSGRQLLTWRGFKSPLRLRKGLASFKLRIPEVTARVTDGNTVEERDEAEHIPVECSLRWASLLFHHRVRSTFGGSIGSSSCAPVYCDLTIRIQMNSVLRTSRRRK